MAATLGSALELASVGGSFACAAAGVLTGLRLRAAARNDRLALRRARERERCFVHAARRLAAAAGDGVAPVLAELASLARTIVPAVDGVLVYEEEAEALRCSVAFGERFAYYPGALAAADDDRSLPARAIARGHHVVLGAPGLRKLHPGDAAAVAAPLALTPGSRCAAVFVACGPLDAGAVEQLVTLADQASPAFAIARDREHDRQRAEYDGLTGLLTPRAFRQRLGALIERAGHARPAPLALLFADTDHFKRWNDTYGHAAGDALLLELAHVFRAAARSGDLVARNGGDEFCLVFVETEKAAAIERAETLRRGIARLDVAALRPGATGQDVPITASIGVATFPADAVTASALLERADAAMYDAKRSGRNAVCYASSDGAFARVPPA